MMVKLIEAYAFMTDSPDEDKDIWVIPLDIAKQLEAKLEKQLEARKVSNKIEIELHEQLQQAQAELEQVQGAHLEALEMSRILSEQLQQAQDEVARLREALKDIGEGNANPPDELLEKGREYLTAFMWKYSQETARKALEAGDE
jgi:hypothetical protein